MSTTKSAKLSKKLGVHLEDAVAVFELLKMPTNKSAKLSDKLGVHLEAAVDVFELLKKELDTNSSSSKCTNTDMFEELNAQKADLKALELELQADRAEFKVSERELKAAKAKLDADRLELEAEKTQFRVAQIQLKAAQSQLEDAKRNLESAQTQLAEARAELEIARKHLEAAKTQTDITNTRLAAAKQSLDAAKMRFEAATKQLNDAKSKFEDATTQLEAATSATATAVVGMEEENVKLRIQVDQLRSEISNGQKTNEAELKKSKAENEDLATDNSKLKNEKLRVEDELKERVAELEQVKNEIKALQADKNKIVEADPRRENSKVFFDMTIRGVSAGRITFELFADIIPDYVELFRAFCTGEKRVRQEGKPFHYKGTSIKYFSPDYILGGNLGTMTSDEAQSIYGDLKPVGKEFIKESYTLGNLFMYLEPLRCRDYSVGIFISTEQNPEGSVGSNVVIGKVIQGIEVLHAIKIAFINQPYSHLGMNEMVIANCGQLPP